MDGIQKSAALTRKEKLEKWKTENIMKKKLENQKKRKPFLVSAVNVKQNPLAEKSKKISMKHFNLSKSSNNRNCFTFRLEIPGLKFPAPKEQRHDIECVISDFQKFLMQELEILPNKPFLQRKLTVRLQENQASEDLKRKEVTHEPIKAEYLPLSNQSSHNIFSGKNFGIWRKPPPSISSLDEFSGTLQDSLMDSPFESPKLLPNVTNISRRESNQIISSSNILETPISQLSRMFSRTVCMSYGE